MPDVLIDTKELSRKYRANVPRLIRAWKKGLTDMELAHRTGIKITTLYRIRNDIEFLHRRARLNRKMSSPDSEKQAIQRHIFLKPLV